MTSEIRVNKLTNRIGLSTVTFADSGIGVTVTGRIDPDTDSARDLGTTSVRWRNAYVDTYYGDGSNLTGISADKIIEGDTKVEVVDSGSQYIVGEVNGSEKIRILSDGQVKLTGNNTGNHMLGFGSNVGGLTIDDVGNQHSALEVQHGSNKFYYVSSSNNNNYVSSYGTGRLAFEHTGTHGGTRERLTIAANGNIGVNVTSPSYTLDVNGDNGGGFTATTNSAAGQLSIVGKNSAGNVSAISRIKSYPSSNGNTSQMAFETRNSSSTMVENLRITSSGQIRLPVNGQQLTWGASQQMKFYYENSEDRMYLQGDGAYGFAFRVNGGNRIEISKTTGDVTMQGSGGKNFQWDNSAADLYLTDSGSGASAKLKIGSGGDLQLYHDVGGANHIVCANNQELKLSANQFSFYDYTGVTQRLRIKPVEIDTYDSLGINVNGGNVNHTNDAVLFAGKTGNADWCIKAQTPGNDYGMYAHTGSGAAYALAAYDGSTFRFRVRGDGTIFAANTTIQGISDVRLKENIVDANSQWDDIKALRFVNYKWNADSGRADGKTYLGLIAQEVEPISPNLIDIDAQSKEDIDNGVPDPEHKSVKYSIVWMKATKALQEAMTRIEKLEQDNIALRARVTNLEGN